MSDGRARIVRAAENEAAFRAANERLRTVFEDADSEQLPFLCECSELACTEVVLVELEVYERVREEPAWFLLRPGHAQLEAERVVEAGDGYEIVEKSGLAGEIARAHWLAHGLSP